MNRKNTIGLVVVIVFVIAVFLYIDFFAASDLPESGMATTTADMATTTPDSATSGAAQIRTFTTGTLTLKLNEKVKIFDTIVTPWAVLEDSRCPSDVQCIQAGKVVVAVNLSSSDRNTNSEMKPGDKVYRSNFTLTLNDVKPYPISYKKTQDGEYRFIFDVKGTALPVVPKPVGRCYVGGCSGQICSNQPDAISTCEYRAEYACYGKAKCEMQASGQCGWTQTPELQQCLMSANSSQI